ncbi:MAG: hypothetical protein U0P45_06490 [Acidimicrobiales bacterium]
MKRASILLATALLLLVGCGTSGGEDATSSGGSTTTAAKDQPPTAKQLLAILPTAKEVGEGYEVSDTKDGTGPTTTTTSDPADDEMDAKMNEACPAFAKLDKALSGKDNDDEVAKTYKTADGREMEIEIDPTPTTFTEANIDKMVDAINGCSDITFSSDGVDITMKLTAKRNDTVGDYGVDLSMAATFQMMGIPMQLGFTGRFFAVDGVGVSITASGGFDQETGNPVEGDVDRVDPLAKDLESRVQSL